MYDYFLSALFVVLSHAVVMYKVEIRTAFCGIQKNKVSERDQKSPLFNFKSIQKPSEIEFCTTLLIHIEL